MKKYKCILIFIGFAMLGKAQMPLNVERIADSLDQLLKTSTSDSVKARANLGLMSCWLSIDREKAKAYLLEGKRLSKNYPYLDALSYSTEGYFYYSTDTEKSEAAFKKADTLLSRFNTKTAYKDRSDAIYKYAVIQQRKDDDEAYTDIVLNKSIPLAIKSGDSNILGSQYLGIGVGFMNIEQYDKAETYINDAIKTLKNTKPDSSRLISAYNRAGENYIHLKKYDKVKSILDTIKPLLEPYPASELYAGYYLMQGLYLHHLEDYKSAINSFDKGIKSAAGPNKVFVIDEMLFAKIKSLISLKRFTEAKKILLDFLKDEEAMGFAGSRVEIFLGLSQSYAGLGQMTEAYHWLWKYSNLNDSLYNSKIINDLHALEAKFQNTEKEKKIAQLEAEKKEALLKEKNQKLTNLMLGIISAFLLLFTIILVFYYRNNRRLLKQKEINHQQQLKEIKQQHQLKFTQAMLEGEERERQRVARDLHDGLGGLLAGIKIKLSSQVKTGNNPGFDRVILQLDQSIAELRRIARNMMPESLLKSGLEEAINDLCESLTSDEAKIEFQAYGIQKNIPIATQANIYRIVQEILSNAIRHAQASQIILQCSQNEDVFLITIEDNGTGFDISKIQDAPGIGFSNVKNRVKYLEGKLDIDSRHNEGTTINIELNVGE